MRRREFIAMLGATVSSPAARAQEPGRTYRLGFLIPTGPGGRDSPAVAAFFDELARFGFVEGQNLTVIAGFFTADPDRLAEAAAAVVKASPDAIVCGPGPYAHALQGATRIVPLVCLSEDLVGEGLVASLARPGGNTTGISILSPELDGKRQDILREVLPNIRRMGALAHANYTPQRHLQELQERARSGGVELSIFVAANREEIAPAIDRAKASGVEALNVLASPLFFVNSLSVIEHIAAVRLAAMYQWPEMARQGGFAAYGPQLYGLYRQRARMVAKVLRGAKPADMPVEQPTMIELVINLKTVKTLGLTVPPALLARADEVIE